MKKIIALFAIMLACGFNANAQQKNAAPAATATTQQSREDIKAAADKAALKDLGTMEEFIQLTNDQKIAFKGLFAYKHTTLMAQPLSAERKAVLADAIEAKLKASLTPDQVAKLEDNSKLLEILTH